MGCFRELGVITKYSPHACLQVKILQLNSRLRYSSICKTKQKLALPSILTCQTSQIDHIAMFWLM